MNTEPSLSARDLAAWLRGMRVADARSVDIIRLAGGLDDLFRALEGTERGYFIRLMEDF